MRIFLFHARRKKSINNHAKEKTFWFLFFMFNLHAVQLWNYIEFLWITKQLAYNVMYVGYLVNKKNLKAFDF